MASGKSADNRRIIGYDIETFEFGWPVGMPTCRALGSGLWEVRSNLTGGTIGSIIFTIAAGEMVLLHGLIKKTKQTPPQAMALADKPRREIE